MAVEIFFKKMALSENLPVYKLSYDLLLLIYRISINMEHYHFTLGESCHVRKIYEPLAQRAIVSVDVGENPRIINGLQSHFGRVAVV